MKKSTLKIIDDLGVRFPKLLDNKKEIIATVESLKAMYFSNNKLLICGNGGSASDSLHIVGELGKSFILSRNISKSFQNNLNKMFPQEATYFIENLQEGIPAISLVNEVSLITAYSNDNNSDLVFMR